MDLYCISVFWVKVGLYFVRHRLEIIDVFFMPAAQIYPFFSGCFLKKVGPVVNRSKGFAMEIHNMKSQF